VDLTPIQIGNDVLVNTVTADDQYFSSVAALAGGDFVVTWSSTGRYSGNRNVLSLTGAQRRFSYEERGLTDGTSLAHATVN
jgi:hypothetical protein